MRPRNAIRNSVFGTSKLASAKTPLLKPYCRLHGMMITMMMMMMMMMRQVEMITMMTVIDMPKTPYCCGISGDLAPSMRKSLAIAIVRFWCAKVAKKKKTYIHRGFKH